MSETINGEILSFGLSKDVDYNGLKIDEDGNLGTGPTLVISSKKRIFNVGSKFMRYRSLISKINLAPWGLTIFLEDGKEFMIYEV